MLVFLSVMEAKDDVIKTSGKCGTYDKEKKVLLSSKTAVDCLPTCIKCLTRAAKELRTD